MRRAFSLPAAAGTVVLAALVLTGCGGGPTPLPRYEKPLAHTRLQTVRTTAYTHTEADHVQYGNRTALGGVLHAAAPPSTVVETVVPPVPETLTAPLRPRPVQESSVPAPADEAGGFHRASYVTGGSGGGGRVRTAGEVYQGYSAAGTASAVSLPSPVLPTVYGSAAADWSRWPAGTVFRIQSTGQLYRVEDYGWALAGRNTIDLYMPSRRAMNAWAVRTEPIEVLHWGDPNDSLRRLQRHQKYRHIRRMVLELQGKSGAAARLH